MRNMPPYHDVIVMVVEEALAAMSDDDDTLTGADVFGEPGLPSERVTHKEPSHLRGYRARRRWVRRSDNRWVQVPEKDDQPETQDNQRTD